MAVSVGELDQRQMDRLRVELAEAIAATFAYPAFFDFHKGQAVARPVDRAKQDEIEQFLASVNFTALERIDVTSLEVRRFLERLLLRYLEVNPQLQSPRLKRRLPQLRARVSRVVAEIQRGLVAHVEGRASAFGARRQRATWVNTSTAGRSDREGEEHNTRVLEATLLRHDVDTPVSAPLVAPAGQAAQPPAQGWAPQILPSLPSSAFGPPPPASGDLTVPVPTQLALPADDVSPSAAFAALASGAQSQVYDYGGISERDTSEMPALPRYGAAGAAGGMSSSGTHPRELPPDLYDLYGDYLRDMHPESEVPLAQPADGSMPGFSPFSPSPNGASSYPQSFQSAPDVQSPFPLARTVSAPPAPLEQSYPRQAAARAPAVQQTPAPALDPATARSDKLIFWQLRYQLEAYVRRAARSYGVQAESGDPSGVIDSLRRSGFVDEADLRIAEGILALTDRVTAGATATAEDYRQALMLYLLYHRSHLNV